MKDLNKKDLLEGVKTIINDSFDNDFDSEKVDETSKFNIRKYIYELLEEGYKNPKLMSYIHEYETALDNGAKDFLLFERFGNGLTKFSRANKKVKAVIEKMNKLLATDGVALVGFQLIENLRDPNVKERVTYAFNKYLTDKCKENKDIIIEQLEMPILNNDPAAIKLSTLLAEDAKLSPNFIHSDYISERDEAEFNRQLQEQRDKKKANDIFEKVKRYLDEQFDEYEKAKMTEKEEYCLDAIANNQGLNLSEHIAKIRKSHASSNEKLMNILDQYSDAINQGAYEERLYETFLFNLQNYNYLVSVDEAIKSINEKVNDKKEEITLTKILEEMRDDHTSFIYVDLIQEDVARYVKEPNAINRVQLRNALMPYASDPYINEMFNIIYSDNSRRSNELQEKAMNIKDQINIIRENATVTNIYTPVQYIKDNECIFNVNGQFYVKKGNNIMELDESSIDKLNDKFVDLCHLVNDPHVEINDDNTITLTANNKIATIYEGCASIHGHKETRESLRNLREMCLKYDDYDTNFYIMCSCLLENFNDIAKIDFAKHITLNENNNISADIFKVDNNIFMTTHNDTINKHIFYSNVNPIFCKNKLNEHMGINVSSLFTDLLPSQDKIILKLNETKNQYEDSIEKYQDMISKLKDALNSASEENKSKLEDAVKDAQEKLDDIKSEYKEWQKETDKVTGIETITDDEEENDNTVIEEPNKPLEDDEVDDMKDEFSQPLTDTQDETDTSWVESDNDEEYSDEEENFDSDEDSDEDDEYSDSDDSELSDEEFDSYLNNDESDEDFDEDGEEDSDEDEEDFDEDRVEDSDDDAFDKEDSDEEDEDSDEEEFKTINFDDEESDEDKESDESDIYDFDNDEAEDSGEEYNDEGETDEYSDNESSDEEYSNEDEQSDEPEATDMFGGDVENPVNDEEESEYPEQTPADAEIYKSKFSYKIADVMFDENVKENRKLKSGSVIVIVPMVDGTGKKYVENKTIDFYLSDDNMPILDNEPMTNELYSAVIDAIKNHPDYNIVCETGETNETVNSVAAFKSDDEEDADWEAEYMRDGNEEDRGYYGLNDEPIDDEYVDTNNSDETYSSDNDDEDSDEDYGNFGFTEDDFKNDDVIIPSYKIGDTEVEYPAANVDNTVIPESKQQKKGKSLTEKKSIKIKPVFKNNKDSKSFF